jgi:2-polyprenyl-6-hydroxyphenyl methylase/3-demethylubiquinone-9 3-methyltransferase
MVSRNSLDNSTSNQPAVERSYAWGHDLSYKQNVFERLGIWLSSVQIQRQLGDMSGKHVADIGCGHQAAFTRTLLERVASATLVDVTLSNELQAHPKVHAITGFLPGALDAVPAASQDTVICNNVLEHLWQPELVLEHIRRVLKPGGKCLLNVPSWTGKIVLETLAFRLNLAAKSEIDDHKAYYTPREFWALLVKSGWKPSQIVCHSHKLGLNTYAVCTKA